MRSFFCVFLALALSGCSIIYKLPTRQGNVIEQKQLDQLQVGMTKDQVKFLLGTPIATSPFRNERWDYFGYYKSPRGQVSSRTVSLYFDDNKLARMEGAKLENGEDVGTPDADDIAKQVKKDEHDKGRDTGTKKGADTGVAIPTP